MRSYPTLTSGIPGPYNVIGSPPLIINMQVSCQTGLLAEKVRKTFNFCVLFNKLTQIAGFGRAKYHILADFLPKKSISLADMADFLTFLKRFVTLSAKSKISNG